MRSNAQEHLWNGGEASTRWADHALERLNRVDDGSLRDRESEPWRCYNRFPLKGGLLNHSVLSCAFVGVWVNPLPGLPKLSQQVLANLFDDPYTTQVGLAPDGSLMVQKMGKPPTPTVLFGPMRFQVQCPSADETARVCGLVMQEAYNRTNQQIPYLAQIGLNTEHEWIKPAFKPSRRWLAEQYVRKGLTLPPDGIVDVEATTLSFVLVLTNPGRRYNIQLQPRAEKENGVFAAINDHREWNQAVPSREVVAGLLEESVREIKTRVTPLILGGVADA